MKIEIHEKINFLFTEFPYLNRHKRFSFWEIALIRIYLRKNPELLWEIFKYKRLRLGHSIIFISKFLSLSLSTNERKRKRGISFG